MKVETNSFGNDSWSMMWIIVDQWCVSGESRDYSFGESRD